MQTGDYRNERRLERGVLIKLLVSLNSVEKLSATGCLINSYAYRWFCYKCLWVSFYLIIINNTQPWEGVVPQTIALLFLSELVLLHFQWPMSPTTQEIPTFLEKHTDFKLQSCYWPYWSYYPCTGWNDVSEPGHPFMSIRPRREDSWYTLNCYLISKYVVMIFILPSNSFSTSLFVLILWFFQRFSWIKVYLALTAKSTEKHEDA